MTIRYTSALFLLACGWLWLPASTARVVADVVPGQFDDFEDGTTAGWQHGPQGAGNPDAPRVVNDGGPGGAGDAYLEVSSSGSQGPGGKLIMYADQRWTGSYLGGTEPDVVGLAMDLINLGQEPLRMWFNFDGDAGVVATQSFELAPGAGWQRAHFSLRPDDLTSSGDILEVLDDVNRVWFFHNESNPIHPAPPLVAILGMDNITAVGGLVMELPIGDFNNSGLVEQGDLDLVLGNWGADADDVPGTWINDPPVGIVDQAELDKVLGNWGRSKAGPAASGAVPEPATWLLLATAMVLLPLRIVRSQRTAGRA